MKITYILFISDPPYCKEEKAYDNKVWSQTNVGGVAELPCPSPLIGNLNLYMIDHVI